MKKVLLICLAVLMLLIGAGYGGIKLFEYRQAELIMTDTHKALLQTPMMV